MIFKVKPGQLICVKCWDEKNPVHRYEPNSYFHTVLDSYGSKSLNGQCPLLQFEDNFLITGLSRFYYYIIWRGLEGRLSLDDLYEEFYEIV